eukprot:1080504-Rhodomonas_salina.1
MPAPRTGRLARHPPAGLRPRHFIRSPLTQCQGKSESAAGGRRQAAAVTVPRYRDPREAPRCILSRPEGLAERLHPTTD